MRAVISAVLLTATVARAQPAADQPPPPAAPPQPAEPRDAAPAPSPDPDPAPAVAPDAAAAPAPAPIAPAPLPAPAPAAPESVTPSRNKDVAWLFVGGALTFATAGTVLAYSTSSAEQDIKDLYVTTGTMPPRFDAATQRQYDDLVDEGERYQLLSYVAFGVAGVCAIGATIFFVRASHEEAPVITPVITPTSAGVSVRF